MERIKFKNSDEIYILDGSTENQYKCVLNSISDFATLYTKLTDDNLSQISYLNEAGALCAIYKDKT
ncbi:hypothetical protein CG709_09890, partial [Lachnotalea glycerini]